MTLLSLTATQWGTILTIPISPSGLHSSSNGQYKAAQWPLLRTALCPEITSFLNIGCETYLSFRNDGDAEKAVAIGPSSVAFILPPPPWPLP